MAKVNELKKVQLLEAAVLNNDIQAVQDLFDEHKTFEFTARALGLACLYANVELVKVLVKKGASFKYKYDATLKRRYGAAYASKYTTYPVNYSKTISRTNINVYNPVIYASTYEFHFGAFPRITKEENTKSERADIAEYLLSAKKSGFDAKEALYYAILWGSTEVAERLIQQGVTISKAHLKDITSSESSIDRNEFLITLPELSPEKCLYALKAYNSFLIGSEKKIILNQRVFESGKAGKSSMLDADVLEYVFTETENDKINRNKVLELIVDNDDAKALSFIVSTGVIKTTSQREKLIKRAMDNEKKEALAWLLDYKNKTADIVAEKAKEEEKLLKELSENPNSVSALKKKWGYKKLENGTLIITSYKGTEEYVEVPEAIGKSKVTVIGEKAFSPSVYGAVKNQESRSHIKTVVLPDGIKEIGERAFYECRALEIIEIPESVKIIGEYAFYCCASIKTIVLPGVKKIKEAAFSGCSHLSSIRLSKEVEISAGIFTGCNSLQDINGLIIIDGVLYEFNDYKKVPEVLEIPVGVKSIREGTFAGMGLKSITLPEGLQSIGMGAFRNNRFSIVYIPKSVTEIGEEAFYWCEQLKDIYISANVTSIGSKVLGDYDNYDGPSLYAHKPEGITVHTTTGSYAAEYMKQYSGVTVVEDYDKE